MLSLRSYCCCEYDYYRPELEDKEEIINNHALLFAGSITATTAATATPLVITVLIQDAVTEEAKEELEGKIFRYIDY